MYHKEERDPMKHRLYGCKATMRVSAVLLAVIMALAVVFAATGSQTVYAEGETAPAGEQLSGDQTAADTTADTTQPKVNDIKAAKAVKNGSKYYITIENAKFQGKAAKNVKVVTWSKTKGTADKVTYTAKKIKGTTWRVTVDSSKHCYSGVYYSKVYVNGGYVGQVTYKMAFPAYKGRLISRAQKKSSRTRWMVLVDKKTHRVGIFKGSKGKWKLVRYWKCGDGKKSTPTPSGTFRVGVKGAYFDSGPSRCYHFTNFKPHYYFHSVCCNPRTGRPYSGKQLGAGVSHGCVRLAKGNARWLQKHLPKGSTVYIYK